MSNLIRVAGLDPSLRNLGIVVADVDISQPDYPFEIVRMELSQPKDEAKKAKTVRKNSDDLRRAKQLHDAFQKAISEAAFAFVEVPVGSQSARAMASYGICIGVLASCSIPMIQLSPTEVKMAGCGVKTATKEEMIEAMYAEHPNAGWLTRKLNGEKVLTGSNEHLADACAAIKAGLQTDEFRIAAAMLRNAQLRSA